MEEFLTLNNQRGIDPITNLLLKDRLERVRQIFRNIEDVAQESGTNLGETVRLVVVVADMKRDRPLVNEIQKEMWGQDGPFPCRTIIQVDYLGDDFIEIDIVSENKDRFIAISNSSEVIVGNGITSRS